MNICDICNKDFSSKGNLKIHKERARYCKNLQNFKCEYCNIIIKKENYDIHKNDCLHYLKYNINSLNIELNNIKDINKKLECEINRLLTIPINYEIHNQYLERQNKELEETLQKERKEYQEQIKDITIKLIEKPNTINNYSNSKNNTTNNTKIDIFNNLSPLTDDDFKNYTNKLTLEHIKKGAEGYADYALNYTLKDKLMCLDYARKKICYKNEQGDKVEEYRLNTILPKIFKEIEPVNKEMILALMNNANDEFLEYEKTITEFDEGDETDKEYSKKIEENQEQIMKYSDILGDCYKLSNGITNNKLGTEITDIVINKIPKNK
jgi:hypothetical protein